MKDWVNLVADKQLFIRKHYTPGRRSRLRAIVLHHNAGTLTTEGCYWAWQTRKASAHYQVEADGTIGQLVADRDTAWHAGKANPYTIGIEHANNRLAPDWTISEATLENGAHLVAALCLAYGLGVPTWGVNVYPHQHFMNTGCPGAIAGVQRDRYMSRARAWYEAMKNSKPIENVSRKDTEMLLLVDGKWWYQTQGEYARFIQDPDVLQKLSQVLPTVKISQDQLTANWIVMSKDHTSLGSRVREIKDLLTGFPGMDDSLKRTSILGKVAEKLGIPPRTN